ncbi:hypothetical protein [Thiomonas sp.]
MDIARVLAQRLSSAAASRLETDTPPFLVVLDGLPADSLQRNPHLRRLLEMARSHRISLMLSRQFPTTPDDAFQTNMATRIYLQSWNEAAQAYFAQETGHQTAGSRGLVPGQASDLALLLSGEAYVCQDGDRRRTRLAGYPALAA